MSINPFEQRAKDREDPEEVPVIQEEVVEESPFAKRAEKLEGQGSSVWDAMYEFFLSPEEQPFEKGMGQSMRSVLPAIGGMPGDIAQLVKGAASFFESKLPEVPEFLKGKKGLREEATKVVESFPTTDELKEKFDILTEGKSMPQNEKEALLDEIGTDIAQLMFPVKSLEGGLRAFGTGLISNMSKEIVKEFGFGEGAQAATKLGTMTSLALMNPNGIKNFYDSKYNTARSAIPSGQLIDAKPFQKSLDNVVKDLSKGLKTVEYKAPVLKSAKQIETNIKKGQISPHDLLEAKIDLNNERNLRVFDPEKKLDYTTRNKLKKNYGKLSSAIDDALEEYGKKNPEFYQNYLEGSQAFGGYNASKDMSRLFKRNLKDYKFATNVGSLIGLYSVPGYSLGAAGAGYGALKSFEMMHRITQSPTLRKYYVNAMIEASKNNGAAAARNIKALDKALSDEE